MLPIFADTAYYLALANPRDFLHRSAVLHSSVLTQPVVTTSWVVQELADGLSGTASRTTFLRIFETIESDDQTTLIPFDQELWRRGLDLFSQRPDKDWSLTDCISFVVMSDRKLSEALTGDHHFEQAGFQALLRHR